MNPVSKLPSVTAFGMHLVDLRRVARERGRVRMVLASMWHVMVPKAPLGCLPIAGYHMSDPLARNSLTAAIRL